jgi:hypothetical protein
MTVVEKTAIDEETAEFVQGEVAKLFGEEVEIVSGKIAVRQVIDNEGEIIRTVYVGSTEDFKTKPNNVSEMIFRFKQWRFNNNGIWLDNHFARSYIVPTIKDDALPRQLNPFSLESWFLVLERDINCRFTSGQSIRYDNYWEIAMIMRVVGEEAGLVRA